jgi:hypothetical protein
VEQPDVIRAEAPPQKVTVTLPPGRGEGCPRGPPGVLHHLSNLERRHQHHQ